MNIFLIGYRGTGKTQVSQHLVRRTGSKCVDTDDEIERRAGKSIAEIFEQDSETVFRDIETEVVAEVAQLDESVISLGGGAVLREQNRQALVGQGKIIWLTASAETIFRRISADEATAERRPNLTTAGGLQEIRELLNKREPVYRQCADVSVDTEGKTPEQVAEEILDMPDVRC